MQSIESQQENSAKFNQILAFIKKNPLSLHMFLARSFTKSIAVPVFAIAMLETGDVESMGIVIGVLARAATRRRRCGVEASRALSLCIFALCLNLDADYYASRLVSRRNLDDAASFNTLRRDDGMTPFPGSDCARKSSRNHH
ncbi:hypothetical protein ACS0PU_006226 [Formica fusca]